MAFDSPEFKRLNEYRVRFEMEPLPDDDALSLTLWRAGFRACFEKPYPVPVVGRRQDIRWII